MTCMEAKLRTKIKIHCKIKYLMLPSRFYIILSSYQAHNALDTVNNSLSLGSFHPVLYFRTKDVSYHKTMLMHRDGRKRLKRHFQKFHFYEKQLT